MPERTRYLYRLDVTLPDDWAWPNDGPEGWHELLHPACDGVWARDADGAPEACEFDRCLPNYGRTFLSRSAPKRIADIITKLGGKATLVRSLPVEWPAPEAPKETNPVKPSPPVQYPRRPSCRFCGAHKTTGYIIPRIKGRLFMCRTCAAWRGVLSEVPRA